MERKKDRQLAEVEERGARQRIDWLHDGEQGTARVAIYSLCYRKPERGDREGEDV